MASKRAHNTTSVKAAWPNAGLEDDDEPVAVAVPAEPGGPDSGCAFCQGHWLTSGAFEHDHACMLAGRAVMARLAERRRNGLA